MSSTRAVRRRAQRRRATAQRAAPLVVAAVVLGGSFSSGGGPLGTAGASAAAASVRIDPDPVSILAAPSRRTVRLSWSGLPAEVMVVAEVCKKSIADPSFDVSDDCAPLTRINPNGTSNGSNTVDFEVFRGPNPDGETPWGCYAPGEPVPPGIEGAQCFVRVTSNMLFNLDDDVEVPLRFVDGSEGQPGTSGPGLVRRLPMYSDEPGDDVAAGGAAPAGLSDQDELLAGAVMADGEDGTAGLAAVG